MAIRGWVKSFTILTFILVFEVSFDFYVYTEWPIGIMVRVFTNGPADQVSISDCVTPKTLKKKLYASLLKTQQFKVRIKGKWNDSRKEGVSSATLWCRSYLKGSLWYPLNYGRPTYVRVFLIWKFHYCRVW